MNYSNRLREVFLDGTWVTGTNYQNEISNLSFEKATKKVYGLNSVSDLTFHLKYYLIGVSNYLETGELNIKDQHSFSYESPKNAQEWDVLRLDFISSAEHFISLVEKLSDSQLNAVFVKEDYGTVARNLDVMIEHAYYHLGQICLIKKMC